METRTNVSMAATIATLTALQFAWILLEDSHALALVVLLEMESRSLKVAQAVLT